ncbi:MAG: phospho-sugar mutase, partial [Acidimicrobiia bacterium]|nr:phospho-sugar mutase [Acidimicrobiia bacterium]
DQGRTVWDVLETFDDRFGAYRTHSFSHRLGRAGPTTEHILASVLSDPPAAGVGVHSVNDLRSEGDLPPTEGVLIRYDDQSRLIVRPSGTEPKVKFYLEAIGDPAEAETRLGDLTDALRQRL